ncbi:hypothetical protein HYPSUDRAFT_45051 [Hypholoma sublateritium FD-334 SS-4]|uniref:Uncharacterized protein n=1 Tax=Hypholoma sublateritium (strain FD-334 SS-4) TaxID=945553 RepID=A0A0D2M6F1_HYPSF|nr:hypothetical protein HYPSUDRAFT_45051 [Hypholoma sublateritium FD-334 SS-4]
MSFHAHHSRHAREVRGLSKRPKNGPSPLPPAKGSKARTGAVSAPERALLIADAPKDTPTKSHDAVSERTAPLFFSRVHNHTASKGKNKAGKPPRTHAHATQARTDAEKRVARAQTTMDKRINKRKERKHAGEAMKPKEYGYLL